MKQIKFKIYTYINGQAKPKQFSKMSVSAKLTFDKAVKSFHWWQLINNTPFLSTEICHYEMNELKMTARINGLFNGVQMGKLDPEKK